MTNEEYHFFANKIFVVKFISLIKRRYADAYYMARAYSTVNNRTKESALIEACLAYGSVLFDFSDLCQDCKLISASETIDKVAQTMYDLGFEAESGKYLDVVFEEETEDADED